MRIHSPEKVKELKKLRRRGYSIRELVSIMSIPQTTVWHHVQKVKVLLKYVPILKAKQGGSAKLKERNWQKARDYARKLLGGPYRDLAIAIAMLYWGEGSKKSCEFINSDGRIISVYLIILRKVLNIPEDAIKPTMRIFSGMNRRECLNYWSGIAKIPKDRFLVRFNDGGTRGKTKYGMCRITIRKGSNTLKLFHSLIDQVCTEIIQKA